MTGCDTQSIPAMAQGLGFALVGVTPAEPTLYGRYIRSWLAEGKHGQMAYLAKHLHVRLDPRVLLPRARSIICVADRYPSTVAAGRATTARSNNGSPSAPGVGDAMGRVARYAWGNDYHRVMKKRLFQLADALRDKWPDHQYKVAVDTAPILEREHAQRAGLGWTGKHTLLIHPRQGSWLLLGQVVTTLPVEIQPDQPAAMTDHCGTCTRCIDACPTSCISPYQLNAERCISYLTIEHRGPIEAADHAGMGNWIAGCDVCQEVCPFNQDHRFAPGGDPFCQGSILPDYATRPPGPAVSLMEILDWDETARRRAVQGSSLKRIKLDMFKRNALIAAGNALVAGQNTALEQRIREMACDPIESALVRLTAQQVIERLAVAGGEDVTQ